MLFFSHGKSYDTGYVTVTWRLNYTILKKTLILNDSYTVVQREIGIQSNSVAILYKIIRTWIPSI